MGDPTPSYAALMTTGFLRPSRWTSRCLGCGLPVTRRWWQRGILAPLPLCSRGRRGLCPARGDR